MHTLRMNNTDLWRLECGLMCQMDHKENMAAITFERMNAGSPLYTADELRYQLNELQATHELRQRLRSRSTDG